MSEYWVRIHYKDGITVRYDCTDVDEQSNVFEAISVAMKQNQRVVTFRIGTGWTCLKARAVVYVEVNAPSDEPSPQPANADVDEPEWEYYQETLPHSPSAYEHTVFLNRKMAEGWREYGRKVSREGQEFTVYYFKCPRRTEPDHD